MKCTNPNCENEEPSGKFCGKCGAPLSDQSTDNNLELVSSDSLSAPSKPGYLTWNTGPGEIARKLSEKALSEYGAGLKGFIIGPANAR